MALMRRLVVALALLLFALPALGQTVEDYGAYGQEQSVEAPDAAEAGLYDDLDPMEYQRIGDELTMLSATSFSLMRLREGVTDAVTMAPTLLPGLVDRLAARSPTGEAGYFLLVIAKVLGLFAAAYLIENWLYGNRLVGPWFVAQQKPHPRGIDEKLPILAIRAALGLIGIALSLVMVTIAAFVLLDMGNVPTQKTFFVTAAAVVAGRASAIIWRMVLSPYLPNYRIAALSDNCARYLFNWLWVTVAASIALIAFCEWIEELGVGGAGHKLITLLAMALTVALNVALVWANRMSVGQAFYGNRPAEQAGWLARMGAALWAPFAILYLLVALVVTSWQLVIGDPPRIPLVVGAYGVLLAVLVAYGIVAFVIARVFRYRRSVEVERVREERRAAKPTDDQPGIASERRLEGDPPTAEGDEESGPSGAYHVIADPLPEARQYTLRSFEDLAKRVATIFAIAAGIYAILYVWKLDHFLDDGRPLDLVEDVIDAVLVGYVLYQSVRIWIDGRIEEEISDLPEPELGDEGGGAAAASRLATLLPLLRKFTLFVITASVLMIVLLELGVNVAPIFAGAGVVGIAIGFGAQALIRDILSGVFFLVDDAFRKGEYIDVGEVKGTVEKISMRSFQLRHHLGALHTIPFGEITHLTNFSRDWVMMKLPLRVTYDTDVEKVRKLIKNLGQELLEHPTEGEKFIQPLKSQGVYMMEDSAMIIRVKFMTRPGDQWTTRKLVYSSIRELFAQHGIKFAHREVLVRFGDRNPDELTDDEREAAAGAARQLEESMPRPVAVGDDR